ncbi:MAG: hypothetical protein HZB11_00710 [Candidatus Yonathbacteria bacterium]|nr:hypothetical protein [Candidatus Yonathbacteria bacterium]
MLSSRLQIPMFLVLLVVAIAVINGFADTYYWYWTMRWFDMPMHFAGGVWLASFGVWWQYSRRDVVARDFTSLLVICFVFAFGVGLLWELYEAGVSFLTVGHINAMPDTLSDLLFDTIGGTMVAVLVWTRAKLRTTQIS